MTLLFLATGLRAQESLASWEVNGIYLTPEEAAWVRAHPRVRLVADPAWAPFSILNDENRYEGSDLDILRLTAERPGITFEDVPCVSWSDALRLLHAGRADVVSSVALSEERGEELFFSKPYFEFPIALIARQDAPFFLTLDTIPSPRSPRRAVTPRRSRS